MADLTAAVGTALYEKDETAWLEQTARLVAEQRYAEIDCESLCEYLTDMAQRDKREVLNRLVVLLTHLLKWERQSGERSNSWQGTIHSQRRELRDLLESGTLRRHAGDVFAKAYRRAVRQAMVETGLHAEAFPDQCLWSLEEVLGNSDEA